MVWIEYITAELTSVSIACGNSANGTIAIRVYAGSVTSGTDAAKFTYVVKDANGNTVKTETDKPAEYEITGLDGGTYTVTITQKSSLCECELTNIVVGEKDVAAVPTITLNPGNEICEGESVTFTATGERVNEVVWNEDGDGCRNPAYINTFNTIPNSYEGCTLSFSDEGYLETNNTANDGKAKIHMSNIGNFNPNSYKFFFIRYRVISSGTAGPGDLRIYFYDNYYDNTYSSNRLDQALINDGDWHIMTIDASGNNEWSNHGNKTGWQLRPSTEKGAKVEIDYIALTDFPASAMSSTYTLSNPPAGEHVVYATRLGGCQSDDCVSKTVTVHSAFQKGNIQGSQNICAGQVDQINQIGSDDVSGGVPSYSYEWYLSGETDPISGANSATFTPSDYANTPGTYVFTRKVRDSFCQTEFVASEGTYTLIVNEVPTVTITPSPVSCNQNNDGVTDDGAIKVEVSGGTGTYSYSISSGAEYNTTTQSFENLTTGEYTVTVTDVNSDPNCSVTSTNILVGEPSKLEVLHLVKNDQDCSHDGSIEFNVQGSHFPYKITWSSPTTTPVVKEDVPEHKESKYIITNLISQTYTVIVEDGANCSVTKTGLAIQPREQWNPTVPTSLSTTVCNDTPFDFTDELNLGSGTEPISYRWTVSAPSDLTGYDSPGAGTYLSGTLHNDHASEAKTATYTVQALKGLYCYSSPFTATVTVQPGEGSAVEYTISTVNTCPGPDVTFEIPVVFNSLPSTPVTATWSFDNQEPQTQENITTTGTYRKYFSVPEISDGCSGSFTYSVKVTNGQCTSNKTNKVEVNIDPLSIPETAYGSETVDCKSDAKAPHKRAQDTEDEGFTAMPTFTTTCGNKEFVTNNSDVDPLVTYTGTDCNGTVTYTYTYTSCNQTTAKWKYVYTVNDNEGPKMATDAEEFPNTTTVKSNGNCAFFYPDVATKKDPTTNKSIFYNYISDNCTDPDEIVITQSPEANTYIEQTDQVQTKKITLYLKDKCGKQTTWTDVIEFTVPARLSASINSNNIVNATCNGGNGSLTVTVAGGTPTGTDADDNPTYNYVWDKDATKKTATLSATAGTHSVVVTDANGCSTSTYANITQPSAVRVVVLPAQQTLCKGEPLTLYASASGGASDNYTYQWYKGTDAISGATTASLDVNESATYKVVAYQGNDQTCPNKNTNNTSVITFNPLPVVAIKSSSTSICPEGSAVLTATKLENVTYEWSDNVDQNNITDDSVATVSPTDNATYTVTVTSSAGCKSQAEATVTVNKPHIELQSLNPQTICAADGNVEIMASTSNFNTAGTNTWQWYTVTVNETTQEETVTPITGQTTTKLQQTGVTATTLYRVVGTNTVGGCPDQESKDVEVLVLDPKVEVPTFSGVTTVCFGGDSTTITATVPNHNEETDGKLSFTWNPISGLSTYLGATVKALPAQSTTYRVTAISTLTDDDSDVECSVNKEGTVEVTVNKPELTLNNISVFNVTKNENSNGTICKDESVKLTANTTAVEDNTNYYTWKVGETVVKNASTEAFYVVTPTATTTYTVEVYAVKTVNNVSCTTAVQTREVTITVNDPQVTINNINIYSHIGNTDELLTDNVVCHNTTVKLAAVLGSNPNGALTYAWKLNDGTTEITDHPLIQNLTGTTTFHLAVTATVGGCTYSAVEDTTVNVRPAFDAGTICNGEESTKRVCYGTSDADIITAAAIAVTPATGAQTPYEYRWIHNGPCNVDPDTIASTDGTFTFEDSYNFGVCPGEHTFTREAKDAECNDWTLSAGSFVLTVDEQFNPGIISSTTKTICVGGEVDEIESVEDASGGRGEINYRWFQIVEQNNVNDTIPVNGNTNSASFTPSEFNQTAGAYKFIRKAVNPICHPDSLVSSNVYTLNVNNLPELDITDARVCAFGSEDTNELTLKQVYETPDNYTYAWTYPTNEMAPTLTGQASPEVKAHWSAPGTYHLTLTVKNNNTNCYGSKTVEIVVDTVPVVSLSGAASVCQSSNDFATSVELTATPAGLAASAYEWTRDGMSMNWTGNVNSVSWNNVGNHTVGVKVTDGHGCSARKQHTVTVNALPILDVRTTPAMCNQSTGGSITAEVANYDNTMSYTYKLDEGTGNVTTESQFTFTGQAVSEQHTVEVEDGNGCKAEKTGVVIDQLPGFELETLDKVDVTCSNNNGSVTIKATPALIYPSSYYYRLHNNTTNVDLEENVFLHTHTFEQLSKGSYTVYVSDGNNCPGSVSFEIEINDTLRIKSIPVPPVLCSGESNSFSVIPVVNIPDETLYSWGVPDVSPDGGIANLSTHHNEGQQTVHDAGLVNTTTGNVQLTYHVVATNGVCQTTGDLIMEVGVTVQPEVTINLGEQPRIVCPEERELTLSAQFGGVVNDATTVTWTFPQVGNRTHTDVVTTTVNTDTMEVTLPDGYDVTYPYTVAFTDGVCTKSVEGTVKVPAKLELVEDLITPVTCFKGNNGSAKIHAQGGTAPYRYTMNGETSIESAEGVSYTFDNLAVPTPSFIEEEYENDRRCGKYALHIVDDRNCSIDTFVTICSPDSLYWKNCPNDTAICCDAYALIVRGEQIIEPVLSTKANIPQPSGNFVKISGYRTDSQYLPRTNPYIISYTAANRCRIGNQTINSLSRRDTCRFNIYVLGNPTLSVNSASNKDQIKCEGDPIDTIKLDFSYVDLSDNGTLPEGLTLNTTTGIITGKPTAPITGTTVYTYTITATSNQHALNVTSCGEVEPITGTITVYPSPTLTLSQTPDSCKGNVGAVIANVTGGVPLAPGLNVYQYDFNEGVKKDTVFEHTMVYSHLSADTFIVSVKDAVGGCMAIDTIEVKLESPYPEHSIESYITPKACSGVAFETVPNAPVFGNYTTTYQWSAPTGNVTDGAASTSAQDNVTGTLGNTTYTVQNAVYTVTPTTGNVCEGPAFTVTVPVNPNVVMNTPDNLTVCSDSSVEVAFTTPVTGGTMSYSWSRTNTTGITGLGESGTGNINVSALTNTATTVQTTTFTVTPTYTNNNVSCVGGTPVEFTITVNPEVLFSADNADNLEQTKTYGAAIDDVTFSFSSHATLTHSTLPAGLSFNTNTNTLSGTPAAAGDHTVTFTATSTQTPNCGKKELTVTIHVEKAALMVTTQDTTKVYGQSDPQPQTTVTLTGLANGDTESAILGLLNLQFTRETGENVGEYLITANGPETLANYTVTYANTGKLTITKATVLVNADAKTKTYGAADPTLTATVTGLQYNDAASVIAYTLSRVAGENVGEYVITPVGASLQGNYTVTYDTAKFTITRANAVVKADNKTKPFGTADPTLTATVTGLVNGDAENAISYELARAQAGTTAGENAGTYTITPTGAAVQGNYNVTYQTGTLTITKANVAVTITGNTAIKAYDGSTLTVTGYTALANNSAYDVANVSFVGDSTASGTGNANSTMTYTMPLSAGTFSNTDANYNATFQVTDGWLKVVPEGTVIVNITGDADTVDYDAQVHSVTGYTVEIVDPNNTYTQNDFLFNGQASVSQSNAGVYPMGLASNQFVNTNTNVNVVFHVTDGKLIINKVNAEVTITGNHDTRAYDGASHTISHYVVSNVTPTFYTESDFTFSGTATATRTDAGTTNMNLADNQFTNTNSNFENVTFHVTDGYQTIEPIAVTVTVNGHTYMHEYTAQEQSVSGYDMVSSSALFNEDNVVFSGYAVAAATNPGVTYMNLTAGQFSYNNPNLDVTFTVNDGWLEIVPAGIVIVNITGHTAAKDYNCAEQSVSGYGITIGGVTQDGESFVGKYPENDTTTDIKFTGTGIAKGTDAGIYPMGLTTAQFQNTNSHFVVQFHVTDGDLTIKKVNAEVTITGNTDEVTYNGAAHTVTGYTISNATPACYSTDYVHFTGSVADSTATRTDFGTTDMNLVEGLFQNTNPNFEVVTFTVVNGKMTVNKDTLNITVNGSSMSREYTAAEQSYIGAVTATSTSTGFESNKFSYTGNTTASGTTVGDHATALNASYCHYNDDNYIVKWTIGDPVKLTITKAEILLTCPDVNDLTKVYDGSALAPVATAHGVNNSDIIKIEYSTDNGATWNTTVPGITNAGSQLVKVRASNVNYDTVTCQYTLTVTPKAVTITAKDSSKTYDGNALTQSQFTASALEDGDTHTFAVAMTSASTITNVGTQPNVIATVDGTPVTTGAATMVGNYMVTTVNGTLTVNSRLVTLTANNASKAYDGTALTESNFTAEGLASTDSHVFNVEMTTASTITSVGTQLNVIATVDGTAITTTGTAQVVGNYTVITANGTLTVTPKPVTLTAKDASKTFDGTPLTESGFTVEGLASTDNHVFSVTMTAASTITNVGSQPNVIAKVDGTPIATTGTSQDIGNYTVTTANGTLTVTQKAMTITVNGSSTSKVFNAAEQSYEGTLTPTSTTEGFDASKFSYSGNKTASGTNVGDYTTALVESSCSYNDDNYAVTWTMGDPVKLTITPAAMAITVNGSSTSKVFDATEQSYEGTVTPTSTTSGFDASKFSYSGNKTATGTNVGDYTTALVETSCSYNDNNYAVTWTIGTPVKLTITPAAMAITVNGDATSKVYNGSEQSYTGTVTATSTSTGFDATKFSYTGSKTTTGTNVGDHTTALVETSCNYNDNNYTVNWTIGTPVKLTITKAEITLTCPSGNALTQTYNGSELHPTATATGVNNDVIKIEYSANNGASWSADVPGITNVGTQLVKVRASNANYDTAYCQFELEVTPATMDITVNGDATSKVYNGSEQSYTGTVTATSTSAGFDATKFSYTGSKTAAGTNVGDHTTALVEASCSYNDNNYTVNWTIGTPVKLTINPAALTININTDKVYDAAKLVTNYNDNGVTIEGNAAGATLTAGVVETNGTAVGSYTNAPNATNTVTITTPFAISDGISNYTVSYNIVMEIKEEVLVITCPTHQADTEKVYDGTAISYTVQPSTNLATVVYSIDGGNTWNSEVPSLTEAGTKLVKVKASAPNYATVYCQYTLKVTPKPVTITVANASKFYGENDPVFTGSVEGLVNNTDLGEITYSRTNTTVNNAGTYNGVLTAAYTANANYTVAVIPGNFEIKNATLTVTTVNQTKVYGANDPTLTVTVTGMQNGDSEAALRALLGLTISRATGQNVGEYLISATGAATIANYNVTYNNVGKLTITAASATVKANDLSKTYGDADPTLTATVTGTVSTDVLNYTLSRQTGDNVGTYPISVNLGSNPNYNVSVEGGTFTINQRPLTIKVNTHKFYDGTALVTNYNDEGVTIEGNATGAHLTAGKVTTNGTVSGTYSNAPNATNTVTINTPFAMSDGISNYNVTTNITMEIQNNTINMTCTDTAKTYDGASFDHLIPATVVSGEAVTVQYSTDNTTWSSTAPTMTDFGSQTVHVRATADNYDPKTCSYTMTVNKRYVKIITLGGIHLYDGNSFNIPNNYTIEGDGFVTGEVVNIQTPATVTVLGTCVTDTVTYETTAAFNENNYNIEYQFGQLCISGDAPITLTSASVNPNAPIYYDGQLHGTESLYRTYVVTYDGNPMPTVANSNGLKFLLPAGDTVTITPTFAGVTFYDDVNDTAFNNVFTYTITHDAFYVGPRTVKYGTVNITKRPIKFTSSASKPYDGTILTVNASALTVGGQGLASTDNLTAGLVKTENYVVGEYTCAEGGFQAGVNGVAIKEGFEIKHSSGHVSTSSYAPVFDVKLTIQAIDNFECPGALTVTIPDGVTQKTLTESELGVPKLTGGDPIPSYVTASSNIADLNPLTIGGTTNVTWTFYDDNNYAMFTCTQPVTVNYEPCVGVTGYYGHDYEAVRVGSQCWFAENLRAAIGDDYHTYNDDPDNLDKFGYLYSWYTAVGVTEGNNDAVPDNSFIADDGSHYVQGICPAGWAIPSQADVEVLNTSGFDANMLKDPSTEYWMPGYEGTGESGFKARAGGRFNATRNRYEDLMTSFHFWQSEAPTGTVSVVSACIAYYCGSVLTATPNIKTDRKSVRCLRKVAP